MNIINSIISWLDLQVGFSKKAQMCLTQERLGGQSARYSYNLLGMDILPELQKGTPTKSGDFYLFLVEGNGILLQQHPEVFKYDAETKKWWWGQENIPNFSHYALVSDYENVMEKALNNAELRLSEKV
jgi:hypothetical protein